MTRRRAVTCAELVNAICENGPVLAVERTGSDFVKVFFKVGPVYGTAHYSPMSGWFFGRTNMGLEFDSREDYHRGEPWLITLTGVFHREQ